MLDTCRYLSPPLCFGWLLFAIAYNTLVSIRVTFMFNAGGVVSIVFMHLFLGGKEEALWISNVPESCSPEAFRLRRWRGMFWIRD